MTVLLSILGFVGLCLFPIIAFIEFNWIVGVVSLLLTAGAIGLVFLLAKKAEKAKDDEKQKDTAKRVANLVICVSTAVMIVGMIMYLRVYAGEPVSYRNTVTECGWCGGSGRVSSGKICSLCDGAGGAFSSSPKYAGTDSNALGLVLAGAGIATLGGATIIKSNHRYTVYN